jgi:hypothetical protein
MEPTYILGHGHSSANQNDEKIDLALSKSYSILTSFIKVSLCMQTL